MGLLECPYDMVANVLTESDQREHTVKGFPCLLNTKSNLCGSYYFDALLFLFLFFVFFRSSFGDINHGGCEPAL